MSTEDVEVALSSIAASLIDDIVVARSLELSAALPAPPGPRPGKDLPAIPQDKRWCSYCGASAKSHKLIPGPDADFLGDQADHFCADEKACIARNRARHGEQEPPEPQQESQQPPESQQEPGQQQEHDQGWQMPEGWVSTPSGTWTARGDWLPPLPVYSAYAHTLMNPAHRTHLLSGQQRPHYYGGPHYAAPGVLSGQQSPQQPAPGGREIPPEGLSPGQAEALHGGRGLDLPLQQPDEPAGGTQRPARSQGRRRGRQLRYQGRR